MMVPFSQGPITPPGQQIQGFQNFEPESLVEQVLQLMSDPSVTTPRQVDPLAFLADRTDDDLVDELVRQMPPMRRRSGRGPAIYNPPVTNPNVAPGTVFPTARFTMGDMRRLRMRRRQPKIYIDGKASLIDPAAFSGLMQNTIQGLVSGANIGGGGR
jgi:hypothetical protein